ncbi:hypothetical protein CP533_2262 [Ophiocordyceps camponoti-saundersi (nom. inval.)]|nr:hypothetical protein CP533_2262 [Ophiocordyceps camponoti-saundersi (nom. inval.)]
MDPVSLSLGIAGILPLVAATIQRTKRYFNAVSSAKERIAQLVTELEALEQNLQTLHGFLNSESLKAQTLEFARSSVLVSCSTACRVKLEMLCKKLDHAANRVLGQFIWPLTEKECKETLQELRNLTLWLQFALSINGCTLLSKTADDVLQILSQQLNQLGSLQNLGRVTLDLQQAVQGQVDMQRDERDAARKAEVLDWISTARHDGKHRQVAACRVPNTGCWLLERPEFIRWRDDMSSPTVLWCHGIPGSGKTVLTSVVVDALMASSVQRPGTMVSFFYLDYRNQTTQTPAAVLSCLLRQIVEAMPEMLGPLIELHRQAKADGRSLALGECQWLLAEAAAKASRCIYVVVDALDECDGSQCRTALLQAIGSLKQMQAVRLFVTSRPHIQDINAAFETHPQIEIEARHEDLRIYVLHKLREREADGVLNHEFSTKLIETLVKGAHGIFLLPVLQLRTILDEPTLGDMEEALTCLSRGLAQAFEDTISRIQRLPGSRAKLGMRVLMWICHAKRVLTAAELGDAMSVRAGQRSISAKFRPSARMMVECCQGLAAVDPRTMELRLTHYAIQEFLEDNSQRLFPRAGPDMALTSMRYLLFDDFAQGPGLDADAIRSRIQHSPFLSYAANHWASHARELESDAEVRVDIRRFISDRQAPACALQVQRYEAGFRRKYYAAEEVLSTTPLQFACWFGLAETCNELVDASNVNATTRLLGSTAIIYAASAGHVAIVRLLLHHGADPLLENWFGNALHCACEAGSVSAVRELLARGMDPSVQSGNGRCPDDCTVDCDSVEALKTLVEHGAELANATDLFHYAAVFDAQGIVQWLLERRLVEIDARSESGLTALHCAAMSCHAGEMVQTLIGLGASIDAVDDRGWTPLHCARLTGNLVAYGRLALALDAVRGPSREVKEALGVKVDTSLSR